MSKYCPVNNFLTFDNILRCPQINVCAIDTGRSLTWCFVLLVEIIIYSDIWVWKEHSRHDGELVYISHIGYIWEIKSFPSILPCFGHFLGTVTTLVSFSIWVNTLIFLRLLCHHLPGNLQVNQKVTIDRSVSFWLPSSGAGTGAGDVACFFWSFWLFDEICCEGITHLSSFHCWTFLRIGMDASFWFVSSSSHYVSSFKSLFIELCDNCGWYTVIGVHIRELHILAQLFQSSRGSRLTRQASYQAFSSEINLILGHCHSISASWFSLLMYNLNVFTRHMSESVKKIWVILLAISRASSVLLFPTFWGLSYFFLLLGKIPTFSYFFRFLLKLIDKMQFLSKKIFLPHCARHTFLL